MQLSDTIAILTRRWYVLLIGLCLTAVVGWSAYQAVPTKYEATGSLLLMPSTDTVGTEGNPYLYLNGMTDARDVLLLRSGSTENREAVIGDHAETDYTLTSDPTTQSPIVSAVAQSSTPEAAMAVMDAALNNVRQNLRTMQDELELPEGQRLSARLLVLDESATPSRTTAWRVAIMAGGIGVLGTLMMTGLIDNALLRRRERRRARLADEAAAAREPASVTVPAATAVVSTTGEGPRERAALEDAEAMENYSENDDTANGHSIPLTTSTAHHLDQ